MWTKPNLSWYRLINWIWFDMIWYMYHKVQDNMLLYWSANTFKYLKCILHKIVQTPLPKAMLFKNCPKHFTLYWEFNTGRAKVRKLKTCENNDTVANNKLLIDKSSGDYSDNKFLSKPKIMLSIEPAIMKIFVQAT